MERVLEPELMLDTEQAKAYSEADFTAPHEHIVATFAETFPGKKLRGSVLDLGCGPADVLARFAARHPEASFVGVDGSEAMLRLAKERVESTGLAERVSLIHGYIPSAPIPEFNYEAIISTSLLHHLPDPLVLWETVRTLGHKGTVVFIADLMRPASKEAALQIVADNSGDEPEILRTDFYNSLLASFTVSEVQAQLKKSGLRGLNCRAISDRHLVISGQLQ